MISRHVFIPLILPMSLHSHAALGYEPPDVYLERLVSHWNENPPDSRDIVGFSFSVAFVNWPTVFLQIMRRHPETFSSWLALFERHTLRPVDDPSEKGRAQRINRQVLQIASCYEKTKYAPLTRAITEKIKSLSVAPAR